ncbi:DUF4872 domain-containing protein (plasmid) [Pseudoalteromonas espejiana]
MQEEIGTGGAGFRFMYASFLEQAAEICQIPALNQCAVHHQWVIYGENLQWM